jgi:CRISPR system Cascade subunit CasC
MTRFLQLHLLTFYPPANLNRDDAGRPKTAIVGGAQRLRLSSQSLKRAWRTSDAFQAALVGRLGDRTKRFGDVVLKHLRRDGMDEAKAIAAAKDIAGVFGEVGSDKNEPADIKQLAFISPEERAAALALANRALAGETIDAKTAGLLRTADTAVDIALFGRMLAANPGYNRDAAAQVAHAITTHKVTVEDDYFTGMDDLAKPGETGAAHIGEGAFGSGVFYLYASIDRDLLVRNLDGDAELVGTAIGALTEAAATAAPSGKQASFAAHGMAQYVLATLGNQQPRTLAGAFAKPVTGDDLIAASIAALRQFRTALDRAYGPAADKSAELEVGAAGSLTEIVTFARDGL